MKAYEADAKWAELVGTHMVRVSGQATCEMCGKRFDQHPWFEGHKIDDGTGRLRPWLRLGCDGKYLKL